MARVKIGDIFEIETPKGKAYLHYVYKDKMMGHLIRVLPHLHDDRPEDLKYLAEKEEMFLVFFPLAAANSRKLVEHVGNHFLENFEKPKYMRDKHIIRDDFLGWHIVDTDTLQNQLVKDLNDNQKRLSPWGIWNDTLLIERLVEGWTLESWD